jgi:thiol peroxidase
MTKITLKGNSVNTHGTLPDVDSIAHDFTFTLTDLTEKNLYSFKGHKLLNIFPSVDTGTCAMSVRKFNKEASDLGNVAVINLSMDLPFAQKRFCGAEGIENVVMGSVFRSDFFKAFPVDMVDGPLKGLCSRVIVVINEKNEITYTEQVNELTHEPNYEGALSALQL